MLIFLENKLKIFLQVKWSDVWPSMVTHTYIKLNSNQQMTVISCNTCANIVSSAFYQLLTSWLTSLWPQMATGQAKHCGTAFMTTTELQAQMRVTFRGTRGRAHHKPAKPSSRDSWEDQHCPALRQRAGRVRGHRGRVTGSVGRRATNLHIWKTLECFCSWQTTGLFI